MSAGPALATTTTSSEKVAQPKSATDQVVPLGKLRQITAQRTTESKQTVPHFYVTVEVDVEKILQLRQMFESEESGKVSINDFVIKACCAALQQMPIVNSQFQNGQLLQHGEIHIGIAAAIEEGLTVPVMRSAGTMSLREISGASKDLVKRAHENKLKLDELSGSTFSISNMGMLKVDTFAAIINVPNAAIVAIGSATKRAVVDQTSGEVVARTRMNITGSFDHRVVDGAVGAEFMNLVRDGLENPTRLLS
jgi:pyruvate dehydrogenase E2 component (dihydrolipoamide acetyltransferase)